MSQKLVWLAVAGALGTLTRYGLTSVVQSLVSLRFPWGTLAVNALGCFLAGLAWSLAQSRVELSEQARLMVFVGFLGGFTTFSAYALESAQLWDQSQWSAAGVNVLAQNILGLAAVFGGIAVGRGLG